jgi:predicted transcriptional regulator of viral defense system
MYTGRMTTDNLNNTTHQKLLECAQSPAGVAVSELTGYSPEQVRRAAEALTKAGKLYRLKLSTRRVRYFANEALAKQHSAAQVTQANRAAHSVSGARNKASWSADEPAIITAQTKIYRAPPLPRNVFRTNTYLQF